MAFGADFGTDTGNNGSIWIYCHRTLNRRSRLKGRSEACRITPKQLLKCLNSGLSESDLGV